MAIITLNPSFEKPLKGWGFLLIDSKRNKFPFKFSHNRLEIKDDIAKDFINDERIIIEFSDGIISGKKQEEKKEIKTEVLKPKKSKKELKQEMKDLNKDEQIEKLKEFGLSKDEIKDLHYEKDRVNKLVELIMG